MESTSNFKHFEKKMMVIAHVFPKLETVKVFLRPFRKNRRFRTCFDSQHVKVSKMLAKSPSQQFYHVFPWFWGRLIWKMSPLALGQILVVFVDVLTTSYKYPVHYCNNLRLPIQMQLFEKRKTFSKFFVPFMKSISNFKHFEQKRWSS